MTAPNGTPSPHSRLTLAGILLGLLSTAAASALLRRRDAEIREQLREIRDFHAQSLKLLTPTGMHLPPVGGLSAGLSEKLSAAESELLRKVEAARSQAS